MVCQHPLTLPQPLLSMNLVTNKHPPVIEAMSMMNAVEVMYRMNVVQVMYRTNVVEVMSRMKFAEVMSRINV